MCFVNDADWTSEVTEETTGPATEPAKCHECRRVMPVGSIITNVHMQEYEECQRCADRECECPAGKCCACPKPSFGNTFDYLHCAECGQFLDAVEEAEIESGCSRSEARPLPCEMMEQISESGMEEAKKYFRKALAMFPDLKASGYLAMLWKRMF